MTVRETTRIEAHVGIRFKVKEAAQTRGMSQYRLAKQSGVDPRTLRKIWHNLPDIIVQSDILARLADTLEVDVSELVESDPPRPR